MVDEYERGQLVAWLSHNPDGIIVWDAFLAKLGVPARTSQEDSPATLHEKIGQTIRGLDSVGAAEYKKMTWRLFATLILLLCGLGGLSGYVIGLPWFMSWAEARANSVIETGMDELRFALNEFAKSASSSGDESGSTVSSSRQLPDIISNIESRASALRQDSDYRKCIKLVADIGEAAKNVVSTFGYLEDHSVIANQFALPPDAITQLKGILDDSWISTVDIDKTSGFRHRFRIRSDASVVLRCESPDAQASIGNSDLQVLLPIEVVFSRDLAVPLPKHASGRNAILSILTAVERSTPSLAFNNDEPAINWVGGHRWAVVITRHGKKVTLEPSGLDDLSRLIGHETLNAACAVVEGLPPHSPLRDQQYKNELAKFIRHNDSLSGSQSRMRDFVAYVSNKTGTQEPGATVQSRLDDDMRKINDFLANENFNALLESAKAIRDMLEVEHASGELKIKLDEAIRLYNHDNTLKAHGEYAKALKDAVVTPGLYLAVLVIGMVITLGLTSLISWMRAKDQCRLESLWKNRAAFYANLAAVMAEHGHDSSALLAQLQAIAPMDQKDKQIPTTPLVATITEIIKAAKSK